MGTGYTRNDTSNNIADGNIINASDLDGEFDAIESALGTSGHTHDGTSAEGGPVTVLGPVQDFVASATEIKPKTTNTLSIGTNSLLFKDMFLDGVATIGSIKIDNAGTIGSASDADAIAISSGGVVSFSQNTIGKTGSGYVLALQTSHTSIVENDVLGKIEFSSPNQTGGGDGALVGASIEAVSENTFSTSVNSSALVFKTNTSAAATERMRIKSDGNIVFTNPNGLTISNTADNFVIDAVGDIVLDSDDGDIQFKDTGTVFMNLYESSNSAMFYNPISDGDIKFQGKDNTSVITALTLDMSDAGTAIFNHDITLPDNGKAIFGAGSDLQIYHDGDHSIIEDAGTGAIKVKVGDFRVENASGNNLIKGVGDVATLLNAGNEKLATTSTGIDITGTITSDGLTVSGSSTSTFNSGAENVVATFTSTDTEAQINLVDTTGSAQIRSRNDLRFYTNGGSTRAMDIDSSGNLIIASTGGTLQTATAGTSNFRAGVNAGNSIASGGNYNTVIGDEAGTAITTGDENVAVGYAALSTNTTGTGNVALGKDALKTNLDGVNNVAAGDSALELNTGSNNTAIGDKALTANTVGSHSTAVGKGALDSQNPATATNMYNVAVGSDAGGAVTTGVQNTIIGGTSGFNLTTGSENVVVGYEALKNEDGHGKNTAIGTQTLFTQNAGADAFNTAVGYQAGAAVTTGVNNTLIGSRAGDALTDADYNVAVGQQALTADTLGSRSTAIGHFALGTQNFTTATNTYNVAVGYDAGVSVTTGAFNTLIGGLAGDALTSGNSNVAMGYLALSADTLGDRNVAIGNAALAGQNFTTSTDSYNVAVGYLAGNDVTTGVQNTLIGGDTGKSITTGINNVIIGKGAGDALTDADYNVALGTDALGADTKGSSSVALGDQALLNQNFTTATNVYNVAVGNNAGAAVTTGVENTLIGGLAGDALTDADFNVAIGKSALSGDTLGSKSIAIGHNALTVQNFTSAENPLNVAVGHEAGSHVTTGIYNTLIGGDAGDALTDADANVAIGTFSLSADTMGSRSIAVGTAALQNQNFTTATDAHNVAVGHHAGKTITTGVQNTLIGGLAGDDITTGYNNVCVGYNLNISAVNGNSQIIIGNNIGAGGNNTARFGTSAGSVTIDLDGSDTSWAAASDERLKKDVTDSVAGLSFIKDLRPITYKWKAKNAVANTLPQYNADSSDPVYGSGKTQHGFIAQEVKTAIDSHSEISNGFSMWSEDPNGTQQVAPAALIPMLVKAIQELEARIATLEG